MMTEWNDAKHSLSVRLAKIDWTDLFEEIPYKKLCDLGVYLVFTGENGIELEVTNDLLNAWGVTAEEAMTQAWDNMAADIQVQTLGGLVSGILGFDEEGGVDPTQSLVLSNEAKYYGAAYIACPGVMKKIEAKIGSFWLLPSSVHEVIVMPKTVAKSPVGLSEMVCHVNETFDPEDRLSDHIYEYRDGVFSSVYDAVKI